ncbi:MULTISPECIES: tetratricopeptide repeat protein [unclassified Paenibacillus]|uniref:tetratricopeptide repeat protein n=1 Tax=unclassified Paenibacillus TaxID=185978 RepID=UPI0030F969A5
MEREHQSLMNELVVLHDSGKYIAAEQLAYQILETQPTDSKALYYLSRTLYMLDRNEEALDVGLQALSQAPADEWILFLLSEIHQDLQQWDEQAAYLEQCLRLDPEIAEFHFAKAGNIINKFSLQFTIQFKMSQFIRPNFFSRPVINPHLLKSAEEAVQEIHLAIQLDPDVAEHHVKLGAIYFMLFRTEEAEQQYRHALQLEPQNAETNGSYAIFLLQENRVKEAREHCELALMFDPNQEIALMAKEQLHIYETQKEHFFKNLRRSYHLKTKVAPHAEHQLQFSKILLEEGKVQPIRQLKAYLRLMPEELEVHLMYGKAHFDAKHYPTAYYYFKRLNRKWPGNPYIEGWLKELSQMSVAERNLVPFLKRCIILPVKLVIITLLKTLMFTLSFYTIPKARRQQDAQLNRLV